MRITKIDPIAELNLLLKGRRAITGEPKGKSDTLAPDIANSVSVITKVDIKV